MAMAEGGGDDPSPDDRRDEGRPPSRNLSGTLLALGKKITAAAAAIERATGGVSESISRTAASAGELLSDKDLRRQGASFIIKEASKGLGKGADLINKQIQKGRGAMQWGISEAPRHLQAALDRVQARLHAQRLAAMLEAERNTPVDVQIGRQVYEDAPQDLRGRLWMVVLERGELIEALREMHGEGAGERVRWEDVSGHTGEDDPARGRREPEEENDVEIVEEIQMCAIPGPGEGMPPQQLLQTRLSGGSGGGSIPRRSSREIPRPGGRGAGSEAGSEGWEVVESRTHRLGGSGGRASPCSPAGAGQLDDGHRRAMQEVFAAMLLVPWPLPGDYAPDSRYSTLLQITVGQDEVDEIIYRDIHRTFPEHPQFAASHGQMSLFRALKAYSIHDLEVGYCQGMAFVAGVILLYLPEEPAFRLFCRLMQQDGPNLRRYYLPGLQSLQCEIWKFEWLLQRHLSGLHAHLEAHGVPALMYCSQWLLTVFSCPFPPAFSARVMDIMLLEGNDDCLLRTAISVMANCCEELVDIDDFEEIISVLKVGPIDWPVRRTRKVLELSLSGFINGDDLRAAQDAWEAAEAAEVAEGHAKAVPAPESDMEELGEGCSVPEVHSKDAADTEDEVPMAHGEGGADENDGEDGAVVTGGASGQCCDHSVEGCSTGAGDKAEGVKVSGHERVAVKESGGKEGKVRGAAKEKSVAKVMGSKEGCTQVAQGGAGSAEGS
ncbi:unnamed protein product [Ostreobium quekettii]|uniref:Rab-GAP TBC domain-containing protein n=1 Tax=Ostreobium quekettii TaxID=121088 RepID=A0A8S1IP60_9CHLO|nr:unnamed protein product [Ostreobium quekettii]|eukprot:evm.model.scf_952.1 EVM.evm.TU.scf_952.1   scf_952:13295-15454(+)